MKRLRIALAVAALALVVLTWQLGGFALLRDPERLKATLLGLGAWGYVVYVVAFAILQPLGLPGIAFVVGAAYVWPGPIAYGLSLGGAVLASTTGFAFARFVARDWISTKLPPRLKKYDAKIEKNGFLMAAFLRLVFLMHPLLHALFGVSRVRFLPYIAGCTLGYIPGIAIATWASDGAITWLKGQPRSTWIALGVGLVGLYAARLLVQRWWRRRQQAAAHAAIDEPASSSTARVDDAEV
ncbi:MAG: VTT domain-containing protein [Polyangiaceae bacterium]